MITMSYLMTLHDLPSVIGKLTIIAQTDGIASVKKSTENPPGVAPVR